MVKPDQIEIPQNPSETDIIAHSIRLLRKIRGFTEGKSIWDPPYTPIERRQFLLDAEQVGSVCANSLITPVNTTGVEERDTWFSTMVGLCPKYSSKREVTWMGYSLDNTVRRMEVKLGALQYWAPRIIDPKTQKNFHKLFPDLADNNLKVKDLFNNKFVVFSPLSSDYLVACFIHKVIESYLAADCFKLKPIILDRGLRVAVTIKDYVDDFDAIKRVGVFVENSTSGATLNATWRAIRVHQPLHFY